MTFPKAERPSELTINMDLETIIRQLREERSLLEQAITSFERVIAGRGKVRGTRPASLIKGSETAGKAYAVKKRGSPKR
jgi:hypothetical protein